MLHINNIRDNKENFITLLKIKNFDAINLITNVITKDDERKKNQKNIDDLLAQGNQLAKQIGELYKQQKITEANELKKESSIIKEESKNLQLRQVMLEKEINEILVQIPNVPHSSVPKGICDADNKRIWSIFFNTITNRFHYS
mgnify:CR=1 FL=1